MNKDDIDVNALQDLIQKKYGKDAGYVLNSDWTEEKKKKFEEEQANFEIDENEREVSTKEISSCKHCNKISMLKKDTYYLYKYKCCWKCYIKHEVKA